MVDPNWEVSAIDVEAAADQTTTDYKWMLYAIAPDKTRYFLKRRVYLTASVEKKVFDPSAVRVDYA